MNKMLALAVLGFSLSSAACAIDAQPETDGTVAETTSALGTSEHDNNLLIEFGGDNDAVIGFEWNDQYAVSDGQPWGGMDVSPPTMAGWVNLDIKAGRHKSDGVANWFNARSQRSAAAGAFDSTPSALNFAVSGTLHIKDGSGVSADYPVVIGQGSDSRNNWWLGVNQSGWKVGEMVGGLQPCMQSPDGKFTITTQEVDQFIITSGNALCLLPK